MTLEQKIEHALDDLVRGDVPLDSNQLAKNIVGVVNEHQAEQAGIEQVTPVEGAMTSADHTAFMLRIFMYLVAVQPHKRLVVDLERVKALTGDHTLDVTLDGSTFTAQAVQHRLNARGLMQ